MSSLRGAVDTVDLSEEQRLVRRSIREVCEAFGGEYWREREVFDCPIGKKQAIQHPLAEAYAHLMAAKGVVYDAANRIHDVDRGQRGSEAPPSERRSREQAGVHANTAK